MIAIVLATALATAPAHSAYHLDLGRYFASPAKERSARAALMKRVTAFEKTSSSSLRDPNSLLAWLNTYQDLLKALQRHDIYVYVRGEEDVSDHADARADSALGQAMARTGFWCVGGSTKPSCVASSGYRMPHHLGRSRQPSGERFSRTPGWKDAAEHALGLEQKRIMTEVVLHRSTRGLTDASDQ